MIDTDLVQRDFLKRCGNSDKILPTHTSLFAAMVLCCRLQGAQNSFRVTRRELMQLSAIRSFFTYHKCMRELVEKGFISYRPSYDPITASEVTFLFGNDPAF